MSPSTLSFAGAAPALPQGSTIIVTGANSLIGCHVIDQLLSFGYRVLGTVRSASRCAWVSTHFDARYPGLFTLVEIPELSAPGAFDSILPQASGFAHVATEALSGPDPNVTVHATVRSTTAVLDAIRAPGSSVKRFVLTSSSAAIGPPNPKAKRARVISDRDWNISAVARAWAPGPYTADRTFDVYGASKTQAELAVWQAYREMDPDTEGLVVNTICPDTNFGPFVDFEHPSSTAGGLYAAWKDGDGMILGLGAMGGYRWIVDVRDTARLHVAALLDPEVRGERLLAYAHPYCGRELLDFLDKQGVGAEKVKAMEKAVEGDWESIDTVDSSRALEVLKRMGREGWIGKDETLKANLGL